MRFLGELFLHDPGEFALIFLVETSPTLGLVPTKKTKDKLPRVIEKQFDPIRGPMSGPSIFSKF